MPPALPLSAASVLFGVLCAAIAVLRAESVDNLSTPSHGYQHGVAALAIFRSEAPYLPEWIEYHRLLGVEHFYLLSNDGLEDAVSSAVLARYIADGIVTLDKRYLNSTKFQRTAYNDVFLELATAKYAEWYMLFRSRFLIAPLW
jgi:hypothetical protein